MLLWIKVFIVLLVSSQTNDADDDMGRVSVPKRMIFWKSSKGEVVIFNPKIYIEDFRPLNRVFRNEGGRGSKDV